MKRLRFDARVPVLVAFGVAVSVGCTWGLPASHSWAADSISPRSCGLGAIVESFLPGHFHLYPPLHMALLTVLSLPWMIAAAARAGLHVDALAGELVQPVYMTGVEASARLVAAAMGLGVLWNTMGLWTRLLGRDAGLVAGAVALVNPVFVYYAHTGNLEVPYLFWLTRSLLEIDRVAAGEPREGRALLYAVAAALTKDQAAAALILPLAGYLVLLPWLARREPPWRRSLVRGSCFAAGTYALGSGMLVNPSGFVRRVGVLFGPASETWAQYPRTLQGAAALVGDAFARTPAFMSWMVALLAAVGILRCVSFRSLACIRMLLPLVAATSFSLFFNLGARRTDHRFLLPQSVLVSPYAAVAIDALFAWRPRLRTWFVAALAVALVPALLGVVSLDATLLADSRYEAERFLAALPAGSRVDVYGGPIFLPRIPPQLVAVRPGVAPVADREVIPGVRDVVDTVMDPRARAPDAIVLATELSSVEAADPGAPPPAFGLMQYRDTVSRRMLRGLLDGSLGYRRALRATCALPAPLSCMHIHGSTGTETWIYVPAKLP